MHGTLIVLIVWWKPFGLTVEWMLIKELTKWTMWNFPMMQKVKCFIPSFRWVTHSWIILQDVFTTSMNLGKSMEFKNSHLLEFQLLMQICKKNYNFHHYLTWFLAPLKMFLPKCNIQFNTIVLGLHIVHYQWCSTFFFLSCSHLVFNISLLLISIFKLNLNCIKHYIHGG